ncbi:MAG: hypothetical protein DRI37_03770 [Chloroflexi bacterium]|nr:MAG: hypothetical protein DRI37_03770 [Chloroflexota bacterium]
MTTQNVTVAYNDAGSGGFTGGFGGGIYSLGVLTLNNSHIMSNNGGDGASGATPTDGGGGGGVYVWGSTVSITNSTIAYNSSGDGGAGSSGQSGRQGGLGGGIYLADNTVATITDSAIQGNTTGAGGTGDNLGGSGGNGGGIYFIGDSLDLTRVFISGNVTGSGGIGSSGDGSGGGCGGLAIFYARGAVSIDQTVIEGNQTGNGRYGGVGGGLCYIDPVSDALSITDSDIVDNKTGNSTAVDGEGGDGGGLYIDNTANYIPSAIVTLTNTELSGNVTGNSGTGGSYVYGGHGGGIYSSDATLTVNSSTIAQNQTGTGRYGGYGGGIYHFSGALTVNSSTISGNQLGTGSTVGGDGGGIYAGGTTHLNHSTISNNAASQSGGGIRAFGTTYLMNSILANNMASVSGPDCFYGINSLGYNLVEDISGCTISGDSTGNITGQDPALGSLQDNGGSTRTHALTPGSPAINEGHPTQCPATDQRGKARPVNQCDIGPFEIQDRESTTNSNWPEDTAVSFGATMVAITRTLGSTSPLTTTVTKEGVPPGGGDPDAGEMSVTWTINAQVDTGLNLDLIFCYTDSELGALNEPDLSAYRYDGANWQSMGGTVDESGNCVRVSGVTALSDWTLATAVPTMPILLSGDVNGRVRYIGSNPDAAVIEVGLHTAVNDPPVVTQTVAVPGGVYGFTAVPNDTYYVSAFIDLDNTGGLMSWYDADGDGNPDPIIVDSDVHDDIDVTVADQYLGPRAAWTAASVGSELAISTAGDVNGDGFDDIIIGARANSQVYVWYGSAIGMGADGTVGNADWSAQISSTYLGHSVASAGDVNGDGYDDIIIGAPYFTDGEDEEGAAFVFYGSINGLGDNGALANADWMAQSNQANADFGAAVQTAGDVNGDGYDDIIIGSPLYDNAEDNEGVAFVYYGSASGLGDNGTPVNADWMVESNQSSAFLGKVVFSAGDVNYDTYDDVLIGVPGYDNGETDEGLVLVFHGSSSGLGAAGTPANADWRAESNTSWKEWGKAITPVGDVNSDHYDDIVISQPPVYGWYGGSGGLGANGEPNNADWYLDSWSEKTVSAAGDTNADGYDDLWIGQPYTDFGGENAGSVRLFGGGTIGLSEEEVWYLPGSEVDMQLGSQVAPAGDVNGDGAADVMATQDFPSRVLIWMGGSVLVDVSADHDGPTILNMPTTFTATATQGTPPQFAWDFGDGTPGTGSPITHTFGTVGMYTAVVTLTNPVSTLTATTSVEVYEEAITGLSATSDSPTLLGETTTLTATVSTGSNVAYTWAFGDGDTGSGAVVNHTYPDADVYTATITATNSVSVVVATTTVTITQPYLYIYLPLVVRNFP